MIGLTSLLSATRSCQTMEHKRQLEVEWLFTELCSYHGQSRCGERMHTSTGCVYDRKMSAEMGKTLVSSETSDVGKSVDVWKRLMIE